MTRGTAKPFVSVIMPVRNEAKHIERSLAAILAQDYPKERLELLIVDGMSSDGTQEIVTSMIARFPERRISILSNPKRIVSAGLNTGIQMALGEVIIRMDAHTQYSNDYISRCLEVLHKTEADNVGGPWVAKGLTYMGRAVAAAFASPFVSGGGGAHRSKYEGKVDTVYLGCWKKSTFEQYGLFDEELVRNQDDEHNLRIWRSGGLVWQSPRIVSFYYPRNSLNSLFRQYAQYGYWKVRVIQKHQLPASWRHLVPGVFLLVLAGLSLASIFWLKAFWAFAGLVSLYILCCLFVSLQLARNSGWDILPVLPLVFASYHIGYGYGFLRGALDFFVLRRKGADQWTQLTR